MSEHAEALVRRLIGAINRRDYDALQHLVAPDYVYRTPGEELRGVAALEGLLTEYHRAFPDLALVIDEMVRRRRAGRDCLHLHGDPPRGDDGCPRDR